MKSNSIIIALLYWANIVGLISTTAQLLQIYVSFNNCNSLTGAAFATKGLRPGQAVNFPKITQLGSAEGRIWPAVYQNPDLSSVVLCLFEEATQPESTYSCPACPDRVRWADAVCVSFVPSSRSLSCLPTTRRGLRSPRGKQNREMERGQVPESPSRGKPPVNVRLSWVITKVLLCKTEIVGPVMAASTTLSNIKI